MRLREYLKNQKLLFDGATGTYYASLHGTAAPCEDACRSDPETVLAIHRAYLDAGANAIKTNTFAANRILMEADWPAVWEIIDRACELGRSAVQRRGAYLFADIGPVPFADAGEEYRGLIDRFLENGVECFLFETFADSGELAQATAYLKERHPDAFVITSFAAAPDGYTRNGRPAAALLREMAALPSVDAVGLNCVSGPSHLLRLTEELPELAKPLSVMPNSGYPTVVDGRTFFSSSPTYFAEQMAQIARYADILGGCCGTTPDYIREMARAVRRPDLWRQERSPRVSVMAPKRETGSNLFLEKLRQKQPVIAVELDPPADSDGAAFLRGASALQRAGVDAITIADCPVARVRADSSLLAAKLNRELGVTAIPHLTCRDRNLNATKALYLGLGIEGVNNLLVVTGDPIPMADRGEVKAVYNFNSVVLTRYLRQLNEQMGREMNICAALNVNAVNFESELRKAVAKQEAGVSVFFTQPVFTDQAVKNLSRARDTLSVHLLGGILPIVSYRNACFMQNEISGMVLPESLVEAYRGLDREQAAALAVQTALEIGARIAGLVDGYYLMTPFGRVELILTIMEGLRSGRAEKKN